MVKVALIDIEGDVPRCERCHIIKVMGSVGKIKDYGGVCFNCGSPVESKEVWVVYVKDVVDNFGLTQHLVLSPDLHCPYCGVELLFMHICMPFTMGEIKEVENGKPTVV